MTGALIKRDIHSYLFSKEFIVAGFVLPLIIIVIAMGINVSSGTAGVVKVSIVPNDYGPELYSVLNSYSNYSIVTASPNVILELTKTNDGYVLHFTGVVYLNGKNPNFAAVEGQIYTLIMMKDNVPSVSYKAVLNSPGGARVFDERPDELVKSIEGIMTTSTVFIFFIILTAISTIITSIIDDRKSRFLYTFMASPAKKSSYIIAKMVSSIIISSAVIIGYSLIVLMLYSGSGDIGGGESASYLMVSPGAILLSFIVSAFSMLFLLLISMYVVFRVSNDKTAVSVSTGIVDALVMPAFIVSVISNMLNFLSTSYGRLFYVLNPATSPVMVIYYFIVGSTEMVIISSLIPVVSAVIAGILVKRALTDLR